MLSHTKNIVSFSDSLKLVNWSWFKFLAIGPLKLLSIKFIYPKPCEPSSLAHSFNLSKKLLGLFAIFLTFIPFTIAFFLIWSLKILKLESLKESVKSFVQAQTEYRCDYKQISNISPWSYYALVILFIPFNY